MNKLLTILWLFLFPLIVFSEDDKLEFTEEQINKFKAAEEKYKDNPYKMKLLNQIKEKLGVTDEPEEKAAPAPPPLKHFTSTEGSMESANAAYAKGDYGTALEQYKAMAAQGNAEANIYVGMMYEAGMGTEADKATAQAWYDRAADSKSTDYNHSKLVNHSTNESYGRFNLTEEEAAKADQVSQELNEEIARVRGEDQTEYREIEYSGKETKSIVTGYDSIQYQNNESSISPVTKPSSIRSQSKRTQRTAVFKPKKIFQMEHLRPEGHAEYYTPEKFIRELKFSTVEKS